MYLSESHLTSEEIFEPCVWQEEVQKNFNRITGVADPTERRVRPQAPAVMPETAQNIGSIGLPSEAVVSYQQQ